MSAPTTQATGRVVRSPHAAWLRVEGHWQWYRRHWHSTLFSSIAQPILFLVAMGMGFGSQVEPSEATRNLPYLVYLAPAMLVVGALQNAVGESSYPVLSGFKWQKDYWAVTATPITPGQLLAGQQIWIALVIGFNGCAFVLIATLLGAVQSPGILLSLLAMVLTGMACSAPVVALAATVTNDGNAFNGIFRFVVMPMTLFSGTFFPVSQLPEWAQPVVWLSPLWHGTELSRAAAFGGAEFGPVFGHVAYLVGLFALGIWLARWRFRRRLVV
ncbi:ABC transporter permease [Tamaricihabitans halophyticus]|uniref:ABC transporter permease n=1 Tax=Tamaricihabitans halophyticus TaxID=1262583 RepID=UPI001048FDE6|nr:ABC transporter permease [Tamaricihabitans halophyticus]